jgi:hypothetical protein
MKELFVGNFGRSGVNKRDVKVGFVTSLSGNMGTILFNDKTSAYFRMADGCHVSFDTDAQAVKFTAAADIKRLDMKDIPNNREVVAVINRFNPNWVYVWSYPTEYTEALNAEADFYEALELEAEARNREWEKQRAELTVREAAQKKCCDAINALGLFRLARAHKFHQEVLMRPAKPATGPMKLIDLLISIGTGRVKFVRSEERGDNDTIFMWFEKQVGDSWVKVDMSGSEAVQLVEVSKGKSILETVQPIVDRLANAGVPKAESVLV